MVANSVEPFTALPVKLRLDLKTGQEQTLRALNVIPTGARSVRDCGLLITDNSGAVQSGCQGLHS